LLQVHQGPPWKARDCSDSEEWQEAGEGAGQDSGLHIFHFIFFAFHFSFLPPNAKNALENEKYKVQRRK
jgi:hypothetical protein